MLERHPAEGDSSSQEGALPQVGVRRRSDASNVLLSRNQGPLSKNAGQEASDGDTSNVAFQAVTWPDRSVLDLIRLRHGGHRLRHGRLEVQHALQITSRQQAANYWLATTLSALKF